MADVINKLYENRNTLIATLPPTVRNLTYKGTWDASTNTPTLADGSGDVGDYYVVSVAGTQDLGSGDITFALGDEVLYNGTIWEKASTGNLNLAQVDEKFIPIKLDDVLKNSPLSLDTENNRLVSTVSIQTPASSLYPGESLRISGANNGLSVYNKATNENFFLVGQQFDKDTIGYKPFMYEYQAEDTFDLQILEDESASGEIQFNYVTVSNSIVNCFIVKGNSASTGVNIKIRVESHTGPIVREIKDVSISDIGETVICLLDEDGDAAELIFEAGTGLYVTVTGADLKGHTVDTTFIPYLKIQRNVYTARDLIDTNTSVTELNDVTDAGSGAIITDSERTKLTNISDNGTGDHWVSGLEVTEQDPKDQTVDYTAGTYLINGELETIATGGVYDLENGYGSINHYTGLTSYQHRFVTLYVDADNAIKSIAGAAADKKDVPDLPVTPTDAVPIALIEIKVDSGATPKDIKNKEITDTRNAPAFNTDEFVKVSADDQGAGHLSDKLSNNGNVTFTIENAGGIETIKADSTGGGALPSMTHSVDANIDGLDVSSIAPQGILYTNMAGNRELRSLAGGVDGQMVTIVNIIDSTIKVKHETGISQMIRTEGAADKTFGNYGGATFVYHASTGYWYIVGIIV